ncbi:MAG: site-specific integrase, partial [Phycisphaeraceae bacterium]|nr:site-specific integrase [Phycisphaeraceae bacterium]
ARRRPLAEALTIQKGNRRGEIGAKMSDSRRERLDRAGRERALIYKTLVLTGLRKGELASITVAQADFTGPVPYLLLHARHEKNRRGAEIPLRKDLAAELRAWMEETLALVQATARERDEPVPARLPPTTKMVKVPSGLIRIFNRDLVFAGIATIEKRGGKEIASKTDERGRTVDIHPNHGAAAHLRHAPLPRRCPMRSWLSLEGAVPSRARPMSRGASNDRVATPATITLRRRRSASAGRSIDLRLDAASFNLRNPPTRNSRANPRFKSNCAVESTNSSRRPDAGRATARRCTSSRRF